MGPKSLIGERRPTRPGTKRLLSGKRGIALIAVTIIVAAAASSYAWTNRSRPGVGQIAIPDQATQPAPPAAHRRLSESVFAKVKPFKGPAVAKYGQARVRAAYIELVNYTFDLGWDIDLISKNSSRLSRADFAYARSFMTPACAKAFDATFAKVVQADRTAIKELESTAFFGVSGANGGTPLPGAAAVTDRGFTQGTVGMDKSHGVDRMSFSFVAQAKIQLQQADGTRVAMQTKRALQYRLVENKGSNAKIRPFLIDAWRSRATTSRPAPASSSPRPAGQ
jgi:hypothetical protein